MSEEVAIKLEAPVAVSAIAPTRAAGLVPLKDQERAQLDAKVDSFID